MLARYISNIPKMLALVWAIPDITCPCPAQDPIMLKFGSETVEAGAGNGKIRTH